MDQTKGKYPHRKLLQIIMHNCVSDELKLKLGFCANLADMFNKLRRLVLHPEYLARSFSEVIQRWNKVTHNDVSSKLKFLQNVLKLERISRDGCLDEAFNSPHVFQLFLGKISEEMLDLLLLGTEEVSESEMTRAFTEFAEVRIKDLLEQQAAEERTLKVSEPSDKPLDLSTDPDPAPRPISIRQAVRKAVKVCLARCDIKKSHSLSQCEKFVSFNNLKKWGFVCKHELCFVCLSDAHFSRFCNDQTNVRCQEGCQE